MSSDKTEIGSRMKYYEGFETRRRLMPLNPAVCRVDGKNFHSFCRDLKRPYDQRLSSLMLELATYLAKEFLADAAYTQSDEITLAWNREDFDKEIFCSGKIQKMNSLIAARTSVKFNKLLVDTIPEKVAEQPIFDSRVFSLPNITEAANVFLWRELDATRNSVQMAGRAYFEHKLLENKSGPEIQEMLFSQKGINWNNYPQFFKRGTFIIRKTFFSKFENIENLPEKHAARSNPDLMVERTRYVVCNDMPPFGKVTNREGVLFFGEDPKLLTT